MQDYTGKPPTKLSELFPSVLSADGFKPDEDGGLSEALSKALNISVGNGDSPASKEVMAKPSEESSEPKPKCDKKNGDSNGGNGEGRKKPPTSQPPPPPPPTQSEKKQPEVKLTLRDTMKLDIEAKKIKAQKALEAQKAQEAHKVREKFY